MKIRFSNQHVFDTELKFSKIILTRENKNQLCEFSKKKTNNPYPNREMFPKNVRSEFR